MLATVLDPKIQPSHRRDRVTFWLRGLCTNISESIRHLNTERQLFFSLQYFGSIHSFSTCPTLWAWSRGLLSLLKHTSDIHRQFQTRESPGIARVKFWSTVLIAHHYIVCGTMGQSSQTVRTTDQSKAWRSGGGTEFFSTLKLTTRTAHVTCPGNLEALELPLPT